MSNLTNLGRVAMLPKGGYSQQTNYTRLDLVKYNGVPWLCRKACTGIAPEEGEYWMCLADKLKYEDLTAEEKAELSQGATEAANLAKDYADSIRAILQSFSGSADPGQAVAAQVTKNTSDIGEIALKTSEVVRENYYGDESEININNGNENDPTIKITDKKTEVHGTMLLNGKAVINDVSDKVDKVAGKGLSTNDYTNDDKEKLQKLPSSITTEATTGDTNAVIVGESEADPTVVIKDKETTFFGTVKIDGDVIVTEDDLKHYAKKEDLPPSSGSIPTEIIKDHDEELSGSSDDFDGKGKGEKYFSFGPFGVKAKAFLDIDGNPIQNASFWKGKTLLAIGDSITAAKKWQKVLETSLGMIVRNHCKGGTTSLQQIDGENGVEPPEYYDPETDASGNLYALSVADVTGVDLIIWHTFYNELSTSIGSINDLYPAKNNICGRINYGLKRIFTLLQQANNLQCRVVMVTPYCVGKYPYSQFDGYDTRGNGASVKDIAEAIVDCANANSVPCLNLWVNFGANRYTWDWYGKASNPISTTYITADGSANDGTNKPFANLAALPTASASNAGKYATIEGESGCYRSNGTSWVKDAYMHAPYNADQLHCSDFGYERMGHVIASFVNMV